MIQQVIDPNTVIIRVANPPKYKRFQVGPYAGHTLMIDDNPDLSMYLYNGVAWCYPGAKEWTDPPDDIRRAVELWKQNSGYGGMPLIEFLVKTFSNELYTGDF